MKELKIGCHAEVSAYVHESMLATSVESGSLPVLATPMMAALMEKAAYLLVGEALDEDETTVGTALDIRHTAATAAGALVTARAELTAVEGRELTFQVSARDEAGEIGGGVHKRFVVKAEPFFQKAEARNGNGA